MANTPKRTNADPTELLLDTENPRFGLKRAMSQDEALEMLAKGARLNELWDSINSQGWVDFEPLVALSEKVEGKWVVIEGNRRAAALQALLNPERLPDVLAKRAPKISALAQQSLQTHPDRKPISVLLVENRQDADAFIGFKHVVGPATWGSVAKAKFARSMFRRLIASGKDRASALLAVQEALGDTNSSSVARMVLAIT